MNLIPSTICFRTDDEQRQSPFKTLAEYATEEGYDDLSEDTLIDLLGSNYAQYDFDRSNYTFVSEFTAAELDGWDYTPYRKRVIQRISDSKYFMLTEHADSWDIVDSLFPGEYGDVSEAKPVQVQTFERV